MSGGSNLAMQPGCWNRTGKDNNRMKLALETSTNICSVALADDAGTVNEKRTEQQGKHSEMLFQFIEELMSDHNLEVSELESVWISEGPGSYTGLRIGASAVKGLLFQTSVPLYTVNTLASFASAALHENPELQKIHSIIDARRVHVYHQSFEVVEGMLSPNDRIEVIPIDRFEQIVQTGDGVIGTGLDRIGTKTVQRAEIFGPEHISAASLFRLQENDPGRQFIARSDPQSFEPKYYTTGQV